MEDMGRYGCTAGNSGGFQREEIYLQVQSKYKEQYAANFVVLHRKVIRFLGDFDLDLERKLFNYQNVNMLQSSVNQAIITQQIL